MLLPNWLPGFWLKVISQPWEGDVTMVLPSMVWQVKKAISNPSKEELYQSLKQVPLRSTTPCSHEQMLHLVGTLCCVRDIGLCQLPGAPIFAGSAILQPRNDNCCAH